MTMTIAIKKIQENWKDNIKYEFLHHSIHVIIGIVCMWYTDLFVHNKSC